MIVWPEDRLLGPAARENLTRLRSTAAAKAFEADAAQWTFHSWARQPDPPYRHLLVSDGGEQATVTIEDNGIWNVTKRPLR